MTDQEKQDFNAMKSQYDAMKRDFHKLQEGWDAELQAHKDTKAARDKVFEQIKAEAAERLAFVSKQAEDSKQQHAAAITEAARTRATDIEKIKADHAKQLAEMGKVTDDLKVQHAATIAKMAQDRVAEVASIKKAHAVALTKEKQRVDRIEFDARQAAELAKAQE